MDTDKFSDPPTKSRGGGRGRPPNGFTKVGGQLVKKTDTKPEGWMWIHRHIRCDECGVNPIFRVCYRKKVNYDLCDVCFDKLAEEVKGQYKAIEPTDEVYEPVQKWPRKRTGATGGSFSAATTEKPNAATAAAGAAEAAPAVAGDGVAPEGERAVVLPCTLFGDVRNVTNKLHDRLGKWVKPEDYEAGHCCAAPWVFAIMPSCITNHNGCAVPPSTTLYLEAIGSGALSGRFALLADDPCSYVTSRKEMKEHVVKFLKPAMASVSNPGRYLNTSLTIIAHGNGQNGKVNIGNWWETPLMLAYWLRTWLGPDAGPSLKHIHLDSCEGLSLIRTEIQRAQGLSCYSPKYKEYTSVADVEFTSFDIDTEAPASKVILELFHHYFSVQIHQDENDSSVDMLLRRAIDQVKRVMPKVNIEQLSREEVANFQHGQAGLAQKGVLASSFGVASKRRLAPSRGGKAPLHPSRGGKAPFHPAGDKAPKRPRYESDEDDSEDDSQEGEEDEEPIEVRNMDSPAAAAREQEKSLAALRREAARAKAAAEQMRQTVLGSCSAEEEAVPMEEAENEAVRNASPERTIEGLAGDSPEAITPKDVLELACKMGREGRARETLMGLTKEQLKKLCGRHGLKVKRLTKLAKKLPGESTREGKARLVDPILRMMGNEDVEALKIGDWADWARSRIAGTC